MKLDSYRTIKSLELIDYLNDNGKE